MNRKVRFRGKEYWLIGPLTDGALVYPSHCKKNGDLKIVFPVRDSFAHVFPDGRVCRYGKEIGKVSEIEFLDT